MALESRADHSTSWFVGSGRPRGEGDDRDCRETGIHGLPRRAAIVASKDPLVGTRRVHRAGIVPVESEIDEPPSLGGGTQRPRIALVKLVKMPPPYIAA